ncbi:translation initiation factor eIF2A [Schizosaccharomyces cryophilus OY26]|uniref:Eukaryotic translation initiation factor 2A n=1 Tax=Schizosaccharomyces cryophilus (strain OY26 / ATCC MYA-4695 / CBS 11777 / NBRC 106824 / NRRL Y48691) TaxID=653667 RepID=S9X0H8_SCHCR|nr:translation initiation factor eIF2A [Schizosaccharomyces cryophilus OY26]EPY50467.1 translation initiation factor eIF2A [Schizosaccharomyces cryophilus OY26]
MSQKNQFAYRSSKTIGLVNTNENYTKPAEFEEANEPARVSCYSPNGKFFAYASGSVVVIVDAESGKTLRVLPAGNIYELGFSPLGNFLGTWERPGKEADGNPKQNMKVWNTNTGDLIFSFVQRNQTGWNLQYTVDEKLAARLVTNEIHFYETANLGKPPVFKLRVEGLSDFALSPGRNHVVAVFVPERKGAPASVRTYSIPNFTRPLSQKTFFKADKVQFKWNALGTSLLVLTQTDVDKSNKNYYGETNLYLLGITGQFDCRVDLDREGPIHDVAWNSNSKEFGIVYGYMPAKTSIFDSRANVIHNFPLAPRNTLLFSPNSRYIMLAGFGNLQGSIDVFDRLNHMKKIATVEASNCTFCEFSPDSQFLLTAVTSPRLRVDNSIKIWHITGAPMFYEESVELYQAFWRPSLLNVALMEEDSQSFSSLPSAPKAHESASKLAAKPTVKPTGAYRPPGARGQASTFSYRREELDVLSSNSTSKSQATPRQRVVPGAAPVVDKNNKKNKTNGQKVAPEPPTEVSDEKKIRSLCKKLRAIDDLKARLEKNEKLEATQVKKVESEGKVLEELKALGWNSNA